MDGSAIAHSDDPECPSMEIPLDPELVRGVPLHHCLRGLGHHWRRQSAGADLDLSQKTEHIDYFLSHDWETSRLLKWMTLLVMFNAPAAAVVTLIVTGVMIPFSVFGFIPYQLVLWQPLVGHLSYLIMLLIWQDLRRLCRKPLLVFLDKLCIAQRDLYLKERGIRGLGSFLKCSRSLTILWSPRYFSRLWCCYEVASYLKDESHASGKAKPIELIPVTMAGMLLIASLMASMWLLALCCLMSFGSIASELLQDRVLFELFGKGNIFVPFATYLALGYTSLFELPEHLSEFRVQETRCFCCSNQHRHPFSDEELPCDRELVFATLQKWFGSAPEGEEDEEYLDRFNLLVQEKLSSRMSSTVGRGLPPLRHVLSTVCVAPVPFYSVFVTIWLWELMHGEEEEEEMESSLRWTENLLELLGPPLYGILSLLAMVLLCRLVFLARKRLGLPSRIRWLTRVLLSLLLSPLLALVLSFAVWDPLFVVEDHPLLSLVLFFVYLFVALGTFCLPSFSSTGPWWPRSKSARGKEEPSSTLVHEVPNMSILEEEDEYVSEYF
ncbi:unnamed protein product [Durusdinium trenchii]|uniref:Uncharacterized protein n=2 Tax=Durusdinium trenchii TaxID=1381693 RepID=A0ABP0KND9_9DINO